MGKSLRKESIVKNIKEVFTPEQAKVLEEMIDLLNELVKADDFNELKNIVARIAKAQEELTIAQKRTEERLEELALAQKKTEEEIRILARELRETRQMVESLLKISINELKYKN